MSKISSINNDLMGAWSSFRGAWSDTRGQWRDPVGDKFEREFWSEWELEMPKLIAAVEELDQAIEQAIRNMESSDIR